MCKLHVKGTVDTWKKITDQVSTFNSNYIDERDKSVTK